MKWDAPTRARGLAMWNDGLVPARIAQMLHTSKSAVRSAAKRYGWPERPMDSKQAIVPKPIPKNREPLRGHTLPPLPSEMEQP